MLGQKIIQKSGTEDPLWESYSDAYEIRLTGIVDAMLIVFFIYLLERISNLTLLAVNCS